MSVLLFYYGSISKTIEDSLTEDNYFYKGSNRFLQKNVELRIVLNGLLKQTLRGQSITDFKSVFFITCTNTIFILEKVNIFQRNVMKKYIYSLRYIAFNFFVIHR